MDLGTRKNPSPLRLALIVVLVVVITTLLNVYVWD